MKKHPAVIAIIITSVGLAVTVPDSRAAGPTNNIPGQSKAQKDQREARLNSVRSGGSRSAEGRPYYYQKIGR